MDFITNSKPYILEGRLKTGATTWSPRVASWPRQVLTCSRCF